MSASGQGNSETEPNVLKGTTLTVYRYLFKVGNPRSLREIQRDIGLSSPSLAEYHVKKLLRNGLVREEANGYIVDRIILENMIRVRRMLIPYHMAYVAFFGLSLLVDLLIFGSSPADGEMFGQVIIMVALGISIFEATKAVRGYP